MCSDVVVTKLATVLFLSNNTIKWRIQELPVDIPEQTIAAANRSGNLISEFGETTDLENDAKFIVFARYRATEDYVEQFVLPSTCQNTTGKLSLLAQTLDNCKQIEVW